MLLLVAAFAGWGYRVVTAGVIGANIGGGFVVLVSPVAALAALAACVRLCRLRRPADPQRGTGTARV